MKPILITPGDPEGIGPEVVVKGLARRLALDKPGTWLIVGDRAAVEREARHYALQTRRITSLDALGDDAPGVPLLDPGSRSEPVEVVSLRFAAAAALDGEAAALVTGPIHKGRLAARGFRFRGHTDFLAHLCGVPHPVMAFVGGDLRLALVTDHLALSEVTATVTAARIQTVLRTTARALREHLGIEQPRIVVCGIDPHAGDAGAIGDVDTRVVTPALDALRTEGMVIDGPLGAEVAFLRATRGQADLVVAMYHDQGLAPLKLLDFGRSVNWTLGLPIVRTSVDHGTADDLVGQGVADPASFLSALALAEQIVG